MGSVLARIRPRGHEVVDQPAHVALVEHARRAPPVLGEHPEPERVERAAPGAEVGRALLELELRLLVVGHGEHGVALEAPIDDEVAEPLGEHPRLARPGRAR